jgi:tRNA (guanine37-N1)-methyltransferase
MAPQRGAARGYDLYGSIAVVEAAPGAAQAMARRLMLENRNVKTVLRKGGAVSGRYRTRKFVYVAGRRSTLAEYRENNCVFRFDVAKVFFSTRLAFERKRVSELVRDGEHVVVMFAGVGPYAIEIAKRDRKGSVIAMELNAAACRYMEENARLNKVGNVLVERGDAGRLALGHKGVADRIVMPLPASSRRFLGSALAMCGRRCIVHYYAFCRRDGISEMMGGVKKAVEAGGRRFGLAGWRIVRPYSATDVEVVLDIIVH